MKGKSKKPKGKSAFMNLRFFLKLFTFCFLLFTFLGCDALVRKFTRKPKTENLPQETMVVVPEEYSTSNIPKEELYRQDFLFWKSWQDELIEALYQKRSLKKELDCLQQAKKNLVNLNPFLNEAVQKKLAVQIKRLDDLRDAINVDMYNVFSESNAHEAERIRVDILQKFSYDKIKDNLK